MAVVHDLAEAVVGDITPHAGVSKEDKFNREKASFNDSYSTDSSDTYFILECNG